MTPTADFVGTIFPYFPFTTPYRAMEMADWTITNHRNDIEWDAKFKLHFRPQPLSNYFSTQIIQRLIFCDLNHLFRLHAGVDGSTSR
jgi:hypothetical protein